MTLTDAASPATRDDDLDALLIRAAAGDCDAFVDFYDRTSPRIYGLLLAITGASASADALLEGIYVEAWERLRGRSSPPCPGVQWMSVIAHRHAAVRG